MAWWDDRAARIQREVRGEEDQAPESVSEARAREAAYWARLDLVLIASQLSSLNQQVAIIKWLLAVMLLVIAYAVYRFGVL